MVLGVEVRDVSLRLRHQFQLMSVLFTKRLLRNTYKSRDRRKSYPSHLSIPFAYSRLNRCLIVQSRNMYKVLDWTRKDYKLACAYRQVGAKINCPQSRIEIRPTALPFLLTPTIAIILWPWLSVSSELWLWPVHMQNIEVKGQLVQKIKWKQTDGRTRPIALPIPLARSIIIIRAFTTEGGMHAVQRLFLARPSMCLSKAGRILVYHRLFDRKTNTCLWFCWYAVCPHSRKRYRVGLSAYTTYVEYTK